MSAIGRTPVLSADGQFYCSPECGGGKFCRKEWYDKAVSDADALCARLGQGWEPIVHENLGWHYRVRKGAVKVYDDSRDVPRFSAWIEVPGVPQIIASGPTPEDAIGYAVQDARTMMARLSNALAVLSDVAP